QDSARGKWVSKQKERLLDSKGERVIANIRKRDAESQAAISLINYYRVNVRRMDYKAYKTIGAGIIGSGAIESARRTVVQKRMKQSGQRWSSAGAQNMLNLRVLQMNGQWEKVVGMIKKVA